MPDHNYSTATNAPFAKQAPEQNPDTFYAVAEQANGRMSDFLMSLSALTDQLCGGEPPQAEDTSAGLRGVPNGHFASAADNCRSIMLKLEQANRMLQRVRDQL